MGAPLIQMKIEGAQKWKQLSKDLKAAPKHLRQELRKEIKDAGKPVVADIRRAALAANVTSSKGGTARPDDSTGLRVAVAKATNLSVTNTGIKIRVSGRKLAKTHNPKLARYLDGTMWRYRRWRHPVFGNKTNWVEQKGDPFFYTTIRRHRDDFRRACHQAMDNVADRM